MILIFAFFAALNHKLLGKNGVESFPGVGNLFEAMAEPTGAETP